VEVNDKVGNVVGAFALVAIASIFIATAVGFIVLKVRHGSLYKGLMFTLIDKGERGCFLSLPH
jgi:hypothetical protein